MPTQTMTVTEGAIWKRLLKPGRRILSREAARSILRIEFAPEDQERMHELAAKARNGSLTAQERDELRSYEQVGTVLAVLKSQARQRLRESATTNGSGR